MEAAKGFEGPPEERIWRLMNQVMTDGLARFDLAIWHWAQSDAAAKRVFKRTLDKRFAFSSWMFRQAGFSQAQAEARGRLMVVYHDGRVDADPRRTRQAQEAAEVEVRGPDQSFRHIAAIDCLSTRKWGPTVSICMQYVQFEHFIPFVIGV